VRCSLRPERYQEAKPTLVGPTAIKAGATTGAGATGFGATTADPILRSRGEARRLIAAMRPKLRFDGRTREVAGLVLNQRGPNRLPSRSRCSPCRRRLISAGLGATNARPS
jgi:hypothetical protein